MSNYKSSFIIAVANFNSALEAMFPPALVSLKNIGEYFAVYYFYFYIIYSPGKFKSGKSLELSKTSMSTSKEKIIYVYLFIE